MRSHRRRLGAVAGVAILAFAAACGGSSAGSTADTDNLEIVSWWTSGSEQQALNTLLTAYETAHSGVQVTNVGVAGGGGSNAQVVLAQRLLGNDPPDVWQTFPGGALSAFVGQDTVLDVSPVYAASGMAGVVPKTILDGLTVDGKQYGVPTSAHRGNVLFFNLGVLAEAGVTPPTSGYTVDAFIADLGKVKASGAVPLCLGAKDAFATGALFENTLLSNVGADGWGRITEDRFDWKGPQARTALNQFGAILDYADPQAAALSWDEATKKLAAGGCGFETLNDSAFGELVKAGGVDGKDFSEVPYPGTDKAFVAVVDTFVAARGATNSKNATDFLATLASPATQIAFSKAKGSVPVRSDADVSSLTPYQQSAAKALQSSTVVWSVVHGEATSPRFQQGFYDAVATYVRSRDAGAFNTTLTDALNQQPPAK